MAGRRGDGEAMRCPSLSWPPGRTKERVAVLLDVPRWRGELPVRANDDGTATVASGVDGEESSGACGEKGGS